MKFILSAFFIILALQLNAGPPEKVVFLKAVTDNDQCVFQQASDKSYPVLEKIPADDKSLVEILKVLNSGMSKNSLLIGQLVKNFMAGQSTDPKLCPPYLEPLYILLIKGGNRPKNGFFLCEGRKTLDKTSSFYIEMPYDPFNFEKLFAHENGHLIDYYIGEFYFPREPSRPVHTTPALTDFLIAFIEGWGDHFEPQIAALTQNEKLRSYAGFDLHTGREYFTYLDDLGSLSQNLKRHSWVKANLFAFSRRTELADRLGTKDLKRNFAFNWTGSDFDSTRLKNAQQMLSSEGFCACIFYRLATNGTLKNNYEDIGFYRMFDPGITVNNLIKKIPPEINVYLKIMYAKHMLLKDYETRKPEVSPPLLADLIVKYCFLFPKDSDTAVSEFANASFCSTTCPEALSFYKRFSDTFRVYYFEKEEKTDLYLKIFCAIVEAWISDLKKNPARLTGAIGPALWIQNNDFKFGFWMFGTEEVPLSINLNAAEDFELMTIPGMTVESAKKFTEYRDGRGFFRSLLDIEKSGLLPETVYSEIIRMRRAFLEMKTASR
ncbi:MAG: hypothetical protein PHW04_03935 [Candidatus Wallbacteria bacterium]|nr:hypothetical protein [Candidatus Wallbacteria bacterium]